MTRAESSLIMLAVIVGLPILFLVKIVEAVGWPITAAIFAGIIAIFIIVNVNREKERQAAIAARRARLTEKYGDDKMVDDMMASRVWTGQTAEQLKDSLGDPEDVDQKILKTKKKEIWKYGHEGKNRYGLRITLDNDVVVGWDKRN